MEFHGPIKARYQGSQYVITFFLAAISALYVIISVATFKVTRHSENVKAIFQVDFYMIYTIQEEFCQQFQIVCNIFWQYFKIVGNISRLQHIFQDFFAIIDFVFLYFKPDTGPKSKIQHWRQCSSVWSVWLVTSEFQSLLYSFRITVQRIEY